MDIINGIGTVFIVIISLLLAPFVWLFSHPLLLILLACAIGAIVYINRRRKEEEREEEERSYREAVQADPFIAIPRKEVERWNGIRSFCKTEEEWQSKRRSIIEQKHERIEHLEGERVRWRNDKRMSASFASRTEEVRKQLPWWEDGGIFDKPLSWGEYKYED